MCVLFLRPRLPGTAMRRGALASHRRKKDPSAFYFFCLALVEEEDVVRNV